MPLGVTEQTPGHGSPCSAPVESAGSSRLRELSAEVKTRILALNPERVPDSDVRGLLAQSPAPQILCVHGGVLPIKAGMNSFAEFLIGMGYPRASLRNPGDGSYTYGYYDSSDKLAGALAWYWERDGLRPMLVGHSQGGIQVIRVLHKLAGNPREKLAVWNPVTQASENRYEIADPLTGKTRPVVGLRVSFATVALSGGLARLLPNEWDMNGRLRRIPDSVEEFFGFQKGLDMLGGDFFGYGRANDYRAMGSAKVRNVRLPATGSHTTIPYASGLLEEAEVKEWIANYEPRGDGKEAPGSDSTSKGKTARMVWATEVWYGIKKHWVLELQRLIRSQETKQHDN
jgi:hypothetical protein